MAKTMRFEGPCPFLMCDIPTSHEHPVCEECGAVRYGNVFCKTCQRMRNPRVIIITFQNESPACGFHMREGDRYIEHLTWEEMLGQVATLTLAPFCGRFPMRTELEYMEIEVSRMQRFAALRDEEELHEEEKKHEESSGNEGASPESPAAADKPVTND